MVLYLTSYAQKVFDGMPEPHYLSFLLSKLDLQASFFLNICLGLAVCHVPSPSSPPSIARADLVTGTTVVSLLFLFSF